MDSINIITANDYYNGLIAEYMQSREDGLFKDGLYYQELDDNYYDLPVMEFTKSWDWLMPVVGKISRDERFLDNEYRESLLDVVPYGHIQDVLDAVVEFIKEHNKIK